MADDIETIKFVLEADDNASGVIGEASGKINGFLSENEDKLKALTVAGAAAGAALALSVKAFTDEEEAITKAARATADAAGGFDNARAQINELNAAMEKQGFSTDKTTEAITLLVTKAGMEMPEAMAKAGDFIAFAESRNIALARAIKIVTGEEKENQAAFDATNKSIESATETADKYHAQLLEAQTKIKMTTQEERQLRDLNTDRTRAVQALADATAKYGADSSMAASARNRLADIDTRLADTTKDISDRQQEARNKAEELSKQYDKSTKNVLDLNVEMAKLNAQENNNKNIIDGALAAREKTLTTQERMAQASERFGNIMERVGAKLVPAVEAILAFAGQIMDAFDKLDPAAQDVILVIGTIVGVITALAGAVAGLLLSLGPVITAFGGFSSIATAASGAMTAIGTAIGAIAAAVGTALTGAALLVAGLVLIIVGELLWLKNAWDTDLNGIRTIVEAVFSIIQSVILGFVRDIENFGIEALASFTNAFTQISAFLMAFITDVETKWNAWVLGIIAGVVKIGTDAIVATRKFVADLTTEFKNLIAMGLQWGADLVANVLKGIQDKAAEIVGAAQSAAASAASALLGGGKATKGATGLAAQGIRPLADGGIISQPTLALLGEGGENEYVIPESKLGGLGGGAVFNLNLTVNGSVDEGNRDFIVSTVQQEFATLWRSSSR